MSVAKHILMVDRDARYIAVIFVLTTLPDKLTDELFYSKYLIKYQF